MIRLVIAEDHISFSEGIELFLRYEEDIELIGFVTNGKELIDLVNLKQPQVVITDIRMPIIDGIAATIAILKKHPITKIIAFTMFDQQQAIKQMMEAGAKGYVLKNSSLKVLLEAVRAVDKGEQYFDQGLNIEITQDQGLNVLTRRQREILKLITEGKSNPEIAAQLFIERSTVETHRKNMIQKLGLSGPGELLRYGLQKRYEF